MDLFSYIFGRFLLACNFNIKMDGTDTFLGTKMINNHLNLDCSCHTILDDNFITK